MTDALRSIQIEDLRHVVPALPTVHDNGDGTLVVQDVEASVQTVYNAYTRSSQTVGTGLRKMRDNAGTKRLQAMLNDANDSRWSWTPNCTFVEAQEQGFVVETSDGTRRVVHPMLFDGPDRHGRGRLLVRPEMSDEQPSWHFFFGEDGIDSKHEDIVRVYWDISVQGVVLLVKELTTRLNKNRIPFHFKCLRDPAGYGRADSGVLYLPRFVWDRASAIVGDIHAEVETHLRDAVPCFTKPLAKGLGLAEDPGGGESFGMTWAERILEAWPAAAAAQDPVAALVEALDRDGVGPGRMHLRPGTGRDYDLSDYTDPLGPLEVLA